MVKKKIRRRKKPDVRGISLQEKESKLKTKAKSKPSPLEEVEEEKPFLSDQFISKWKNSLSEF